MRMRTNFLSSGTQIRWRRKFGAKMRGTFFVMCRPTPPFFFARPRRWMTLPRMAFDPVMLQTLDIEPQKQARKLPRISAPVKWMLIRSTRVLLVEKFMVERATGGGGQI